MHTGDFSLLYSEKFYHGSSAPMLLLLSAATLTQSLASISGRK